MSEPWAPKDRDEYVGALREALIGAQQHSWDEGTKLKSAADELAAKNPPKDPEPQEKPKRRGIL